MSGWNARQGRALVGTCAGSRLPFALVWLVLEEGIVTGCQESEEMISVVGIGHGDGENTDIFFQICFPNCECAENPQTSDLESPDQSPDCIDI
jgi:hypothetical protein